MLRLCVVGVICTLLFAGGVDSNTSSLNVEVNEGAEFGINVLISARHNANKCRLKTPQNVLFTFTPGDVDASTEKYNIGSLRTRCSVIVKAAAKNDEGVWEITYDHDNEDEAAHTASVNLTVNVPEIVKDEDEGITLLTVINHYIRKDMYIDISLDTKTIDEECYVRPPNGVLTKLTDNFEMANVIFQNKSKYVSCRITLGPMSESLLGDWRLCGKSKEPKESKDIMRCQPANIVWNGNNPDAELATTTLPVYDHPVHIGGSVNPGVSGSRDTVSATCHVITPDGEDLVITNDVEYPHIQRIAPDSPSLCSINFYNIDSSMIGEWTIYGKFLVGIRVNEMRRPLRFFLYNEDQPNEQAYNVTTLPEETYSVILGRTLEVNVRSIWQVNNCQYKMPTGQSYDLKSTVATTGIVLKKVDTTPACQMTFRPVSKDMMGEWQLIGKFSNGNQFNEIRQLFRIKEGNIENSDSYTRVTVDEGHDHRINLMISGHKVTSCHLKTPQNGLFRFVPGDESLSTVKYHINRAASQNFTSCSVTVQNVDENDEGLYVMSYNHENEDTTDPDIIYVFIDVNTADKEDEPTMLTIINHYTSKEKYIDISLDKKTFDEECYVRPPNGVLTKTDDNFKMANVKVQSKSNYVSCRITLGPMSESLLGDWRLCGKSEDSKDKMRCQPANIVWNDSENPGASWDSDTRPVFDHPVHFGGSVNPGVAGHGNVATCHVITPDGEDLVITNDVKYPHIQRIAPDSPSLCSINFYDIDSSLIGEWTIYGKFRSAIYNLNEIRQPLRFFLYNEDQPSDQAYNITTLPEDRYLVILGRPLEVNVKSFGQVNDCQYRTPSGHSYDLNNAGGSTGIILKTVTTTPACRITFSSITEDLLGEWQLIGKFRDGNLFNERRQPFRIIREDPENPIIDVFRVVENLTEIIFDSKLGASHRVTINKENLFVENESCHLLTPQGRQYAFLDGFYVPNVGILEGNGIDCGVEINVQSLDMLGEWTLISRATRLSTPIERRQSFTILIEETSSLGNAITITEGADLYLSLPNATYMYDTCKLYGPNGEQVKDFEVDELHSTSCGYIIRNVNPSHRGTWAIVYGNTITYKATVEVNILALVEISVEDLILTAGSAVIITVGPEDAVYCTLSDSSNQTVFDGFGPCRIVLDRVTMDHKGNWRITVGVPGTVVPRYSTFYVAVLPAGSKPIVTTAVARNGSAVMLTCSVPIENEVHACLFRNPGGNVLVASHGVGQDGYTGAVMRYESDADSHDCRLRLLSPSPTDHLGIWRCAVNTARDTSYGFLTVNGSMLDQPSLNIEPELRSTALRFDGTEGDALPLTCSIAAAVRYCYFRAPNGTVFNVGPSTSSAGYEYVGNGLDAGECGIRFNNLWLTDSGNWSCSVGLIDSPREQSHSFYVSVSQRMSLFHGWLGDLLKLHLSIWDASAPALEYCRFVRSDGLGFTSFYVPYEYILASSEMKYGTCDLTIPNPTSQDLRPWTVSAKVVGLDHELSMTSTPPLQRATEKSAFMGVLVWSFFSILCLLLILAAVSLVPKKNRKWTYERAASIRNSFRKQPPPAHTDILTDLPQKI